MIQVSRLTDKISVIIEEAAFLEGHYENVSMSDLIIIKINLKQKTRGENTLQQPQIKRNFVNALFVDGTS